MYRILVSILIVIPGILPSYGQDMLTNFDEAKIIAVKNQKFIMLNFSGSDWCGPCIKMKNEIFSNPSFKEFAAQNLILVNADFPRQRKNKLSEIQIKQNEALAEKYNLDGDFPKTILFTTDEKIVKEWIGFPKGSVQDFIGEIAQFLPEKKSAQKIYKHSTKLMGCRFDFSIQAEDQMQFDKALEVAINEIKRVENLISSWDDKSQTSKINSNAGIKPVKVDKELVQLIVRSKEISKITQGAFDISFGSIDENLWKFDGTMTSLPDSSETLLAVKRINYKNIETDETNNTVFLKEKGMKIGFGAIGKGYAAECVKKKLSDMGITAGVINASGDMTIWGQPVDNDIWTIGIANPNFRNMPFSSLKITNKAVVTSGDYEKFVVIDGKKYSHIIDPRTGFPASGLKSITVIAPNAELADALATAVFVLGKEVGLDLINQLDQIESIIINEEDEIFYSDNIKIY
ncbi:MAG: FAD:protein FMN transferase [Bacteroidales bacterium]|nr:FAD:protein FMN transferase [Bacteroidales bacterium]